MKAEIIDKVERYIAENILRQPSHKIEQNTIILSSGLVDSFSLVDLALFIEDEFGVHIDDTELNSQVFDTIEELAGIIENRK